MKQSAGIMMVENDGSVWMAEPTGHFGGYVNTFPKGGIEPGMTAQETAKKETWEETGIIGKPLVHLGDYQKSTSVTTLYVGMKVAGAPWQMGWETQGVKLVPKPIVNDMINQSTCHGKVGDLQAAKDLYDLIDVVKAKYPHLTLQEALEAHGKEVKVAKLAEEAEAAKLAAAKAAQDAADKAAAIAAAHQAGIDLKNKALNDATAHAKNTTLNVSDMTQLSGRAGLSGAQDKGIYQDASGQKWLVKYYQNPDQAKVEVASNHLMKLAGVDAPESVLVNSPDGKTWFGAKFIPDLVHEASENKPLMINAHKDPDSPLYKSLANGFAADVWLANWDTVGQSFDNTLAKKDPFTGEVIGATRIDQGGCLTFNAMGGLKGSMFNSQAVEWDSYRNPANRSYQSVQVYEKFDEKDLVPGARRIAALTEDQIRSAVYKGGIEPNEAERIISILLDRQKAIRDRFQPSNPLLANMPKVNVGKSLLGTQVDGMDGYQEAVRLGAAQEKGITLSPDQWRQKDVLSIDFTTTSPTWKIAKQTGYGDANQKGEQWITAKRWEELEAIVGPDAVKRIASAASSWQGDPKRNPVLKAWHESAFGKNSSDPKLLEAVSASYSAIQETFSDEDIELVRGSDGRAGGGPGTFEENWNEMIAAYLWGRKKIGITHRIGFRLVNQPFRC